MTLTWDFTEEARSLSEQGGGELSIIPDPLPLASGQFPSGGGVTRFSTAFFAIDPAINYPWRHGGSNNALTLTFEQECPKKLELVLTPSSLEPVQPRLPGRAIEPVTVDASVKTCSPQPGSPPESVVVTFRLEAPQDGTEDAGGHFPTHIAQPPLRGRPKGNFEAPETGPEEVMCTVTNFDSQGTGRCEDPKTYFPPDVSGKVKIVADTLNFGKAEKKISVAVTRLAEMGAGSGTLVLVGAPNNHAGTNDPCRSTAPTSRHFENHFGRPILILAVEGIADRMFRETGILLRVNDMSLQFGGLFDINNNWRTPHREHRVGLNADIGFTGVRNGVCPSYNRARLLEAIVENARRVPLIEGDHFHVRLP